MKPFTMTSAAHGTLSGDLIITIPGGGNLIDDVLVDNKPIDDKTRVPFRVVIFQEGGWKEVALDLDDVDGQGNKIHFPLQIHTFTLMSIEAVARLLDDYYSDEDALPTPFVWDSHANVFMRTQLQRRTVPGLETVYAISAASADMPMLDVVELVDKDGAEVSLVHSDGNTNVYYQGLVTADLGDGPHIYPHQNQLMLAMGDHPDWRVLIMGGISRWGVGMRYNRDTGEFYQRCERMVLGRDLQRSPRQLILELPK